MTVGDKRKAVHAMQEVTTISERKACLLVGINRASMRYQPQSKESDVELSARIQELALERKRFGYRRIHHLLRREGTEVNHKRVYRLYQRVWIDRSKTEAKEIIMCRARATFTSLTAQPYLVNGLRHGCTQFWS